MSAKDIVDGTDTATCTTAPTGRLAGGSRFPIVESSIERRGDGTRGIECGPTFADGLGCRVKRRDAEADLAVHPHGLCIGSAVAMRNSTSASMDRVSRLDSR